MKWTVSSLYLLVFISLLGFGWALDRVYDSQLDQSVDPLSNHRIVFESFWRNLDQNSNEIPLQTGQLPDLFQLEHIDNFPLPESLTTKLTRGELIILESDQGLSLHRKLTDKKYVLGFGPLSGTVAKPDTLEFTLTIIFYLGVALVLIVWITPLIKSVQKLSTAARKVGEGDLDTRLNTGGFYLTDLNRDFNGMIERLNTLNDNNQLFSQAVSHDLRTPLARIKFALEKLGDDKSENQSDVIDKIQSDIAQIENLTGELLDYARIGQTREPQKDEVDIDIFLQQVIAQFSERCDDIQYQVSAGNSWIYQLDSNLFHKVIDNLIKNGLDYATQTLRVELTRSNEFIEIIFEDDGPGIKPEIMPRLFAPFQMARHKSKTHFGLGLAICHRAIKLLEGSITADNQASLGGARFIVRLPV